MLSLRVGHGVDWFEKLSNDNFARYNGFHELECLLLYDPFSVHIFDGFVNVSCFRPLT